jgi:hypothetical protein
VTGELEKLTMRGKYKDKDHIHGADGASMRINHIGLSIVNTPHCKLMLKNVFHVQKACKNLIYVYHLTKDNYVYLEIQPDFLFIKDQVSKKVLLRGRNHYGLYPIPSSSALKQTLGVFRPSLAQWHGQLGHPTYPVVAQVINKFNLPILDESNKESVCNVCQQAKSHQLSYSLSQHKSQFPLELTYSDVWGPTSTSDGGYKYCLIYR